MKAFELRHNANNEFVPAERPMPQPRRGEVVVRMLAASLNYRDHQIVEGSYHIPYARPLIPLSDGVGEIVSVGEDVTRFSLGQRVAGTFWQRWIAGGCENADPASTLGGPLDGVLAEYARFDEQGAVLVPEYLTDLEAATLPCAAVTAWRALVTEGALKAGDTVLVQGTGGVSIFALQFATLFGAHAIVASRSAAKLERARSLGARDCIEYTEPADWAARVLTLTAQRGVDHIVDVGGPASFAHALQALRPGGQINVVGYLGGMSGEINPLQVLGRQARLRGLQVGPRECFEAMNRALATNRLRPVVDSVFPWTDIALALERLRQGRHFGKIVLKF